MNKENTRILRRSISSLTAIIIIFIVAFYEVPSIQRDVGFYYFVFLLCYGALTIFLADIIIKPNFQNLGQKISFFVTPFLYILLIVAIRLTFNIFTVPLLYFIIITLLITVFFTKAMKSISSAFVNINKQEVSNRSLKISEGIKKIRLEEISALVKGNSVLMQDVEFKHQFELLINAMKYGSSVEMIQTNEIDKEINHNIEVLNKKVIQIAESADVSQVLVLIKKIIFMIEEREKIAKLYYQ